MVNFAKEMIYHIISVHFYYATFSVFLQNPQKNCCERRDYLILIVCIDSKGGMMFNHRRQSQDIVLRERILERTGGSTLLMNEYSAKMFGNHPQIRQENDPLKLALDGEYAFIEDGDIARYEEKIEKIILYKWNRDYPSDTAFDIDLDKWVLAEHTDFIGKSHDKITEEIFERGDNA